MFLKYFVLYVIIMYYVLWHAYFIPFNVATLHCQLLVQADGFVIVVICPAFDDICWVSEKNDVIFIWCASDL